MITGRLSGQASGSGGGGDAVTDTLVFQPGGEANGNVYVDWETLYAALIQSAGRRTVVFDDQFSAVEIPAGEWAMTDVVWRGTMANAVESGNRVTVQFAEDATVTKLRELHNLTLVAGATPPFQDLEAGDRIVFCNCVLRGALVTTESMAVYKTAFIDLREYSEMVNDDGPVVAIADYHTLVVNADLTSTVESDIANGGSLSNQLTVNHAGAGAADYDQSTFDGEFHINDVIRKFAPINLVDGEAARPGYLVHADNSSAPVSITLPQSNLMTGSMVVVIMSSVDYPVTLSAPGDQIDGADTWIMSTRYSAALLIATTSAGWRVLSQSHETARLLSYTQSDTFSFEDTETVMLESPAISARTGQRVTLRGNITITGILPDTTPGIVRIEVVRDPNTKGEQRLGLARQTYLPMEIDAVPNSVIVNLACEGSIVDDGSPHTYAMRVRVPLGSGVFYIDQISSAASATLSVSINDNEQF